MANLQKLMASAKATSMMEVLFDGLKHDRTAWNRGLTDDQLLECIVVSACRLYTTNVQNPPQNIDAINDLITVVENKDD